MNDYLKKLFIDEVKPAIEFTRKRIGFMKNLINYATINDSSSRYINSRTGKSDAPSSDESFWVHTDYIPVVENKRYYIFNKVYSSASTAGSAWYDKNKTFLKGFTASALKGAPDHIVTAPSGAAFLRHSFRIGVGYNEDYRYSVSISSVE